VILPELFLAPVKVKQEQLHKVMQAERLLLPRRSTQEVMEVAVVVLVEMVLTVLPKTLEVMAEVE
jgi:hypothetical protein